MEFKDHLDCVGRPIVGSDMFQAIPSLEEYTVAQEAIRVGMIAALQNGAFTYQEAALAYDISLQVSESHRRLVTPEKARILARLLDMGGSSLDDNKPEVMRCMAEQLRNEADVRDMLADLDDITPDSFDV